MSQAHKDRTAAAQSFAAATAAAARGDAKDSFRHALMALALDPDVAAHRRLALSHLRVMGGYRTLPEAVRSALLACVDDETLDMQPLAMVVRETVGRDPRLDAANVSEEAIAAGRWDWLCTDPLVIGGLRRAINIDLGLERVMTALRRHALLWQAERGRPSALMTRHATFVAAMALQCQRAGFPWATTDAEWASLETVGEPKLLALYRAVEDPDQATASDLPQLTPIDDDTSHVVARQYERHPYPPWDAPSTQAGATVKARRILVAGCGTGQGAVALALAAPEAKIVAFDLSRASVAYAKRKADQFVPGRIAFGIGDILNVAALGADFDLIDCSGVLHHMADPGRDAACPPSPASSGRAARCVSPSIANAPGRAWSRPAPWPRARAGATTPPACERHAPCLPPCRPTMRRALSSRRSISFRSMRCMT
jgi:hypothetical protein